MDFICEKVKVGNRMELKKVRIVNNNVNELKKKYIVELAEGVL